MPMGQGIATSYAQLVVDVFGVEIERIRIVQGDTDRGQGFGSAGSRSLFTAGSAINHASETVVANGRDLAAEALEAAAADIEYESNRACSASPAPIAASACLNWPNASRSGEIYVDSTSKVAGPS
jgi:aerobic carbon-monoxide dehydrogenase large subunit